MPTIVRLGNVKIAVYANDHNPPHFHLLTPDHSATVSLETLEITAGFVPTQDYGLAVGWARNNMELLRNAWASLND